VKHNVLSNNNLFTRIIVVASTYLWL